MPGKPSSEDVARLAAKLRSDGYDIVLSQDGGRVRLAIDTDVEPVEIFSGLPVGWAYVVLMALVRWERSTP